MAQWRRARAIVERLIALNISPYTPDPLTAISNAEGVYGEQPPAAS
jgi:hypothetical protein